MRRIILLLAVATIVSCCKQQNNEKQYEEKQSQTVKVKPKDQNNAKMDEVDSATAAYLNMDMGQLVKEYKKNRSNKIIPKVLSRKHEIEVPQYLLLKYAFWKGESPKYFLKYTKAKIEEISNYPYDYISFDPTDDPVANDITYKKIMLGEWEKTTTCYPIAMFVEIKNRMAATDYVKVMKGYNFIDMGNGNYEEHTTVLLEILTKDDLTIGCYDISHDPGN